MRIVKAAAANFASDGFRVATIRQIAEVAGVNEITVYRYFPKKNDLYWEVIDWKLRSSGLIEAVTEILKEEQEPASLVQQLSKQVMTTLSSDQSLGRLMHFSVLELDSEKRKLFEIHLRPSLEKLSQRISNWIREGRMRAVDPQLAALAIFGSLLSNYDLQELLDANAKTGRSLEELSRDFADLCVLGLGVNGPTH